MVLEDTKNYDDFKTEWRKTHKDLKGCHLKYANINRNAMEAVAAAEHFEATDMTEYVAYAIQESEGGYILREYHIIQNKVVDRIDSQAQAKNFIVNAAQMAIVKQALKK